MYIKKPLFVALLIICMLSGVSCISASDANDTTLTIENQEIEEVIGTSSENKDLDDVLCAKNDENALLAANSKSFTDLNDEINGNNQSEVFLNGSYVYDSTSDYELTEGVIIDRDVTVYGNGCTIDGVYSSRIFNIKDNNSVIFHNITFINADGGLWASGSAICGNINCTAINCIFNSNRGYYGAAIHGISAVNCSFSDNWAFEEAAMKFGYAMNCTFYIIMLFIMVELFFRVLL